METARTPPSRRSDTTWVTAPPLVNTTPGSPFTVVVCISQSRAAPTRLTFSLLGDDDVLDVCGVQHHGQDARLALLARVPRHAVQAAGRLVEGVADLERPGGVVVDGPLVLALEDVAERRARVAVRRARLARP